MKVENNSTVIGRNIYFFIGETQMLFLIPNRNPFQADFSFFLHKNAIQLIFPDKTELLEKLQRLEQKIQDVQKQWKSQITAL